MLTNTYIFNKSSRCKMTGLYGFVLSSFLFKQFIVTKRFIEFLTEVSLPNANSDSASSRARCGNSTVLRFLFLILKCFPSFIPCEIGEKSNCPHCLMHHNSETHSILVILNPSPAGGSWISDTEYEFSTFKSITVNSISVKGKPFLLWQKGFPDFHCSPGELNSLINETRM